MKQSTAGPILIEMAPDSDMPPTTFDFLPLKLFKTLRVTAKNMCVYQTENVPSFPALHMIPTKLYIFNNKTFENWTKK